MHLQHLKWFVGKICFHTESNINIKTNTWRGESVVKYLLYHSYESPFNFQNPPQMGIRQLLPLGPLWRFLQVVPGPSLPFPGGSPLSHRLRRRISKAPSWLLGVFGLQPFWVYKAPVVIVSNTTLHRRPCSRLTSFPLATIHFLSSSR